MNNKRKSRKRGTDELSEGAAWWLRHGSSIISEAAQRQGFKNPQRAAWEVSNLHYARAVQDTSRQLTRAKLREAGYGAEIDKHIAARRCPPDNWQEPPGDA